MIRRIFLKLATLLGTTLATTAIASDKEMQVINGETDTKVRQRFWSRYGQIIDTDTLDPLNPFNAGYPLWPGNERQFLLLSTHRDTRIAFTDGLSDVSGADSRYKDRNGLELELFLETDEKVSTIQSGWAVNILLEVSRAVVNHGAVGAKLKELKYITVQLDMDGAPDEWSLSHKDGNIGVFLGLPRPDFPQVIPLQKTFFSPTSVKLMRPAELRYAIEHGAAGREKLAQLYATPEGLGNISNLDRRSVI